MTQATTPVGTIVSVTLDCAEPEPMAQDLGAVKSDHQPDNDTFRVLFDPAGHPFCLTTVSA